MFYRWKQFQGTTTIPLSQKEYRFSAWLASIRKDVECAFGILKKRFRCLKLPLFFKSIHMIEHVFVTCCMLHNMMIDERMVCSLRGGWSRDDVIPPLYRNPIQPEIIMRANDKTNYFKRVHQFGSSDGEGDSYQEWRDRYIEHFYYLWIRKKHKWNSPYEPWTS